MNRSTCIDASVAVKWLFDEAHTDRADKLRSDAASAGDALIGPPLLQAEITSAVYKRFQRREISMSEATDALSVVRELPLTAVSPPILPERAFEIASQLKWKWIYDAFYVALADIIGCELWTADAQLHRAVRSRHPNVRLLSEYDVS